MVALTVLIVPAAAPGRSPRPHPHAEHCRLNPGETMRILSGRKTLDQADHLVGIYAAAFAGEPWSEGPEDVAAFRRRLQHDVDEPGFRAVVASDGFASGWLTTLPLSESRAYPGVTAHLGSERLSSLLDGALVVDELAVRPAAQGAGLGRRLLTELVRPGERAWLLTSWRATAAIAFYRRLGWQEVAPEPGVDSPLALFVHDCPDVDGRPGPS